ncbi:peptidase domain-containing ABC transporter [Ideonella sp. 4Y11]|uniref:Cyclolysin secretion/processing ATP-binding protein CyaB n=1 Tax=Ideonella aquatica TaxID=2824119 RepID=A0A940YKI4_9BURK|nr:peptidase domain-containing ABC transporter [Ideonella aquatica]MBQ0961938.1 peptidase domain-containing ABC transporter [Ideonella aquatica]
MKTSPTPPSWLERLQMGWTPRLVPVLQTEAAECGLACVAMLLGHHGTLTDLATLRSRHGASPQGMTLADLSRVAQAEHLATRAVRLETDELSQLRLPCVLHWDLAHFVVLVAVEGTRCRIVDPASGERRIGMDELSRRFTGVALEAWPDSSFVPREEAQPVSVRRLIGRVEGLTATLWRVFSVSLLLEALALASPLFMQWVVDHVVVSRDTSLLGTLAIGFVLLLLVQQVFTVARAWLVLRVGTQLRVQWRSNVLQHLLKLPLDWFARRHLGDVMSRFGSVANIQQVLTTTFVETALDGLMVLFTLGLMLLYSPWLTLFATLAVLAYALLRALRYRPLREASAERLVRGALESSHLLETVRGIRTLRLFDRTPERMATWQTLMVAEVNAGLKVQRLDIVYRTARRLLTGLAGLGLLWLGAREVMAGTLSVGMLLAFLAYRTQFDTRFGELINKYFDLRMLQLDAQRLSDIVLTAPEVEGPAVTAPLSTQPPAIEIDGLAFRYAEGTPEVLRGLTLRIAPGESVAITGPSGCGKTTLLNLLLGVHTPQRGEIRVDGQPLPTLGLARWRAQVGTVLQDDTLFAGSIADNISCFDPRPDPAWIEQCARLAAVHEDIARMPMGYHSLVGDMGSTLSGGQRQRVVLARALYRRPRVLILDEATSHLDLAREAEVGSAIARQPVTRIIVAHRPQTLALADRVIEIGDGGVLRDEPAADYAARQGLARA